MTMDTTGTGTTMEMVNEARAAQTAADQAFRAEPTNHALYAAYVAAQQHAEALWARFYKEQAPARALKVRQYRSQRRKIDGAE